MFNALSRRADSADNVAHYFSDLDRALHLVDFNAEAIARTPILVDLVRVQALALLVESEPGSRLRCDEIG
jgi:hypothetical protein